MRGALALSMHPDIPLVAQAYRTYCIGDGSGGRDFSSRVPVEGRLWLEFKGRVGAAGRREGREEEQAQKSSRVRAAEPTREEREADAWPLRSAPTSSSSCPISARTIFRAASRACAAFPWIRLFHLDIFSRPARDALTTFW